MIRALRKAVAPAALVLCLLAAGCEGRPRHGGGPTEPRSSRSEPHVGVIDLGHGAPERAEPSLLATSPDQSFAELVGRLRELPDEQQLRGLFVRIGTTRLGFARAAEIGRLLSGFREQELPVTCHADSYSNSSALLAALGCDQVWLSPGGTVDTVGIAAQLLFGKELLTKLSIEADFLQVGRYKGAIEPFTRNSASPEARRSLQQTLSEIRDAWLDGLGRGRDRPPEQLGAERGPHVPERAQALGLIDRIGFDHEAQQATLDRAAVESRVTYFGGPEPPEPSLAELVRLLSGSAGSSTPHVAVVRATGAITMSGGGLLGGADGIAARPLIRLLRRLGENEAVRAVVLRIDSPGGSALASDLVWHEIMRLREQKPVVASIGEMAASGGIYLASAATEIVAEQTSIVGSIGVMGGKLAISGTLAEIGITVESVRANPDAGDRALLESPFTAWDEATRSQMRAVIEQTYDLFLRRVAAGRKRSVAALRPAAEGRLFGGLRGQEVGLVDRSGGLSEAIDRAMALASLDPSVPVQLADPPARLLDLLVDDPSVRQRAARRIEQSAARAASRVVTLGLEPYRAEIYRFVGSVSPLLEGERSCAALPYALAVR